MNDFKMEVRWVNPRDLIPYANNAKVHSPDQIDQIASQIASFGFDQPIVVDARNVIIKGHGRREAAIKLNLAEVPVVVSTLDEYQAMAARIADNAVVSKEYNKDKLKFDLGTLKMSGLDLKLTGLKPLELKSLVPSDNQSKQIIDTVNREEAPSEEEYVPSENAEDVEREQGNPDAPVGEESGGYFMDRTPVIQYNIVFDDVEQQEKWHAFVAFLKEKYPSHETIAARLIEFIGEKSE